MQPLGKVVPGFVGLLWLFGVIVSCSKEQTPLFVSIPAEQSGIHFSNRIFESDTFNILNFHYIYNGGGVGVADFNKDGYLDLVFSGNQVPSALYLNRGKLTFSNISSVSGFAPKGWVTGISIADINADTWPDIYLSVGGLKCQGQCYNQLFIHQGLDAQGNPHFLEQAADYGLSDGWYTQQAAFFDYDLDGDLDVYLVHNTIDNRDKNAPSAMHFIAEDSKDHLLENNGRGSFLEVSDAAGITHRGYGLGIAIDDFNQDGFPDIYVANDFLSNDLLYLNLGKEGGVTKGFEEVAAQQLKHTSYNAMGVDIADINQDQLPDIVVLDMLPDYNERQKTMIGFMNYNKFQLSLRQGYHPQFIRNTLQVHNGFIQEQWLPFSETGYFSGIHQTDWSWTPLLADYDNDGDKDLFVTNGYGKDITDLDFINYSQQRNPFGTKETQEKELYEVVQQMESIKLPNQIFENTGQLRFKNQKTNWLNEQASISNGAVYADLDLDGDLDIIVNNINEVAYVLENQLSQRHPSSNYLKVQLKGLVPNTDGIGTSLQLWSRGKVQRQFFAPVRGYLSSLPPLLHFGLGANPKIDSLVVAWPDGQVSIIENIKANRTIVVEQRKAKKVSALVHSTIRTASLLEEGYLPGIDALIYQENNFQDFDAQGLILHQHSRQGPCLLAANVDGKPGEELFIGGAKGFPVRLFHQNEKGDFIAQDLGLETKEVTDAAFIDIDGDGDKDLYVVCGGTEMGTLADGYMDHIFWNEGKGIYSKDTTMEMAVTSSGSCVRPCDYNKDGRIDLFVGGRVQPQQYPQIPLSFLLQNSDEGLADKTAIIAPQLRQVGMVTDAVWTDYNADGWMDLLVVGEWMPITIFTNKQGSFPEEGILQIEHSTGLWNAIAKADLDEDGDEDFILGNLGLNSRLQASVEEPLTLYTGDLDQNGSFDPFIGQFFTNKANQRKNYPIHARDDVVRQVVKVKSQFVKYLDFGKATFEEVLGDIPAQELIKGTYLKSAFLENKGEANFQLHPLPNVAQLAPIQDILIKDIDRDGHLEILLTGNDFTAEKNMGWYDAFNGLILKWDDQASFKVLSTSESGFWVGGDARDIIALVDKDGREFILAGQNKGPIKIFQYIKQEMSY